MSASAVDCSGSSATVIEPVNSANLPRTLLTIMCRAENPIRVCAGSRSKMPGAGMVTPSKSRVPGV